MSFRVVKCDNCGEYVEGMQLTEEQREWLDGIKEGVIDHMKLLEEWEPENEIDSAEKDGWFAIAQPFLFLYGYMISREDKE